MKKTLFIFAGFVVVVFMTCNFFIYNLSLYTHKSEFQNNAKQLSLKTEQIEIALSDLHRDTKQIQWFENNKEIKYNNELFDVVSEKGENGKIVLNVINDRVEKNMIEKYKEQADTIYEKNQSNTAGNKLMTGFLSLKCIFNSTLNITVPVTAFDFSTETSFPVCIGYLTVQTPPPSNLI